ncbi:MAG: hypothetical protein H6Q72_3188 [Firmicutes bacterium]|nr:hypothetical protein [Bacillota bacterium]
MGLVSKYGDLVFIVAALLYGLTREPQTTWSISDTVLMVMLLLVAANRIRKAFKPKG